MKVILLVTMTVLTAGLPLNSTDSFGNAAYAVNGSAETINFIEPMDHIVNQLSGTITADSQELSNHDLEGMLNCLLNFILTNSQFVLESTS